MPQSSPDRKRSRLTLMLGCLLVLVVLMVFQSAKTFEFIHYDEVFQLVENPLVRSLHPANVLKMFSVFSKTSYYPVRLLSFAIDYGFWELNPTGYHVTNILLHAASALLLFWLILRLGGAANPDDLLSESGQTRVKIAAAIAAGLFALHPAVVEVVAWVSGREELLMVFFIICCMHFFISALDTESRHRRIWSVLAVLSGACACMSNVLGAVIPFVLGSLSLTIFRPPTEKLKVEHLRTAVRRTWPFWILSAAALVLKKIGSRTVPQLREFAETQGLSIPERAATVLRLYALNLRTLVFPRGLVPIYPPVSEKVTPDVLLIAGLILAAGTVLLLWSVRKNRTALLAVLWVGFALGPSAQVIPHHISRADRFLYLPLTGVAFAAFLGLRWLMKRRIGRVLAGAAGLVMVCAAGLGTWDHLAVWRNSITLYEHCLDVHPDTVAAHYNIAIALGERGRDQDAVDHLQKVIAIRPDQWKAHNNLGAFMKKLGRTEEAIFHLQQTVEINPDLAESHCNLGVALNEAGRYDSAVRHLRKALELDPEYARGHYGLGYALGQLGQDEEAVRHLNRALEIDPEYAEAHSNLGGLLSKLGRTDEAIRHYRKAISINPDFGKAHSSLGVILDRAGQSDQAIEHFKKAIAIDPANANAYYNMGVTLSGLGRIQDAVRQLRKALQLNPGHFSARYNLANILMALRRPDLAVAEYKRTLDINSNHYNARNNMGFALFQLGRYEGAEEHYRAAIEINPQRGEAHYGLAMVNMRTGRPKNAVSHFRKVVELDPDHDLAGNTLAWILATHSDPDVRDGAEAVRLAEAVCRRTSYRNPAFVATLAAAHAETRRFGEAVRTCEKALELARAANNTALTETIGAHLESFRKNQPLRLPIRATSRGGR